MSVLLPPFQFPASLESDIARLELRDAYAKLYAKCESVLASEAAFRRAPDTRALLRSVARSCRAARTRFLEPWELRELNAALTQLEQELAVRQLSERLSRTWLEREHSPKRKRARERSTSR